MGLVDYPDSDDDQPEGTTKPSDAVHQSGEGGVNACNVPPPPPAFHNLYATANRVSTGDDPSLHGGRIRNTPHVEGYWPSHVYVEWLPDQAETLALTSLLASSQAGDPMTQGNSAGSNHLHSLLMSDLGVPLPLHISLSRSLMLQGGQREDFRKRLEVGIRNSGISRFSADLHDPKWVSNYEGTRSFLVLGISRPRHDELNRLLQACNMLCSHMKLPELYEADKQDRPMDKSKPPVPDRSDAFHFSIAWRLTESTAESNLSSMQFGALNPPIAVQCSVVKLKMGNEIIDIALQTRNG